MHLTKAREQRNSGSLDLCKAFRVQFWVPAGLNMLDRPGRVFSDQRFGIARGFFQGGQGGFIAGVSQGDADISQKAAPFRS